MTATVLPTSIAPEASRRPTRPLAGTGVMIRFVLRRNRIRLLVWWATIVGLFAYVAAYYTSIFTTQKALDDFAAISDVPSIKALTGLAAAPATLGGAVWTKIWMTCALLLAFAVVFLVTRSGRADEEAGRTELLRSRMLGIHAYSVASWLVNAGLCVTVGLGIAIASAVGGLDPSGTGITGSLVLGASITGVGLVALGVAAVAGEVAWSGRGANALASIVIGVLYVVRMVGDLGSGTLTWASPIGWAQEMAPWGANRWWPFLLLLVIAGALLALAGWLEGRRDLGAGLLPERSGHPDAPARYASPLGLALRLERGPIIGWSMTVLLTAFLFGTVVDAMSDLMSDASSSVAAILRGTGVEALLSMLVMMIAMIVTVFAIQVTLTLRGDEARGIIEPQLAGAISRRRWVLERLIIPAAGSAVLLFLGGALLGISYASTTPVAGGPMSLAWAALAYWPAVMVFVGFALLLFGWLPRLTVALSWGVLAAMWVVIIASDALRIPDWLLNVLPFFATPYQPMEAMNGTPVVVMSLIALLFGWLGLARFERRDIAVG